jgi:hypothetical protein
LFYVKIKLSARSLDDRSGLTARTTEFDFGENAGRANFASDTEYGIAGRCCNRLTIRTRRKTSTDSLSSRE